MDRHLAVAFQHETRTFLRAGGAAFEVTADSAATVAPVDQLSLQRGFRCPVDLREAAVEGDAVIAAIGLAFDVERGNRQERVGHVGFRNQLAAAERDAIDTELAGWNVGQALATEVRLEAS